MEIQSIVISAFVTIFALGLLIVSFASYRKYKNLKLLFVSGVFVVFLLKGLLMSFALFFKESSLLSSSIYAGLFDLMVLLLLFMATLKR